ncbi:MAG: YkgJ family cysteine cluster protein [Bilophila sp.]
MPTCTRCGKCCQLGGAVLHLEDLTLLARFAEDKEPTKAGLADLVTLRKGELARDDVAGTLLPLEEECVKIAPPAGDAGWTCRFLQDVEDETGKLVAGCRIYAHRPAQCRALDCSDTRAISALYATNRATRTALLHAVGAPEEWSQLILAHEETCAFARVAPLARLVLPPLNPGSPSEQEATEALLETIRYDISFRTLCVERGNISPSFLPFLLGRPLTETLDMFGLTVRPALPGQTAGLSLVRKGQGVYGGLALFD